MKILLVSHYALPHTGGIEAVVDGLARGFTDRGHDVVHLASAALRPGESGPRALGYRVQTYRAWNGLESRAGVPYPVFSPLVWPSVIRELRQCDVLHAHGMLCELSIGALVLARRVTRTPSVLTEHVGHVPYESRWLNALEAAAISSLGRLAARSARAVIVLNPQVHQTMEHLAPLAKICTIRNGVDLNVYRPAESDERRRLRRDLGWDDVPRVLFVGRMVEKKGLPAALEAARIAAGHCRLVLAGPGEVAIPRGADVEVLGPLSTFRVAELYGAADALLLPSRGEGFPLVAQEAMASGLPVILAAEERYRSTLDGAGEGAILVEPRPELIAKALVGLFQDDSRLETARADALRFATQRFGRDRAIEEHLALYRELVRSKVRPSGE